MELEMQDMSNDLANEFEVVAEDDSAWSRWDHLVIQIKEYILESTGLAYMKSSVVLSALERMVHEKPRACLISSLLLGLTRAPDLFESIRVYLESDEVQCIVIPVIIDTMFPVKHLVALFLDLTTLSFEYYDPRGVDPCTESRKVVGLVPSMTVQQLCQGLIDCISDIAKTTHTPTRITHNIHPDQSSFDFFTCGKHTVRYLSKRIQETMQQK